MKNKRVLAFSSSRVGNGGYLQSANEVIKNFLGTASLNIAFIPFAIADNNYEDYVSMVKAGLKDLPYQIDVALPANAKTLVANADLILVGGGNTFKLLHDIYELNLFEIIQQKVNEGTPYIGWSAGANLAGKTIGTTNDMPVIQPQSFISFGFLPFQLNPHYTNLKIEGHNGESRDQRLQEYLQVNKDEKIIALPEGTYLHLQENSLIFRGGQEGFLFLSDSENDFLKKPVAINEDLSFLL